jgi:hypothetical protein
MALGWLVEAAEPLQALSRSFLCAVHIRQLQRDNLYTVSVLSKTTNAARPKPSSSWSAHRTVVHSMSCLCSKPPMNLVDIQQIEKSAFPGALLG